MPVKRGIGVWIFVFLTFFAALNALSAVILWVRGDPTVPRFYLIGDLISELQVEMYFWTSIVATLVFLGITCIIIYQQLPPDPEIIKMFVKVGGNLTAIRKTQEATAIELIGKLEKNKTTSETLFKTGNTNVEKVRIEILNLLKQQENMLQRTRQDQVLLVENKISETREEILNLLSKHETTIHEIERLSKRGARAANKQRAELTRIRTKLDIIEDNLLPIQPELRSRDELEKVKGIGPRLGEELRFAGITDVGELITIDSTIISEKTRTSREMAERLQAFAQLLMVPGVSEKDSELLLEAGITSRIELAEQDPIQLDRRMGEIIKTHIRAGKMSEDEKPRIEEISNWIKMAKY